MCEVMLSTGAVLVEVGTTQFSPWHAAEVGLLEAEEAPSRRVVTRGVVLGRASEGDGEVLLDERLLLCFFPAVPPTPPPGNGDCQRLDNMKQTIRAHRLRQQ